MDNKAIGKIFKLYAQLMELHDENPFRTKSISSAVFKIDKLPFPAQNATIEELSTTPGIGKSIAEKIKAIIESGTLPELDVLRDNTPDGVIEMMQIKGLGPKKIQVLWKKMGIESVGELYYACNENRLIEAKGFGLKTQEDIKKNIEFNMSNVGWFLYAKSVAPAEKLKDFITHQFPKSKNQFTGDFRRKCETLKDIEVLTTVDKESLATTLSQYPDYVEVTTHLEHVSLKIEGGFSVKIYTCVDSEFGTRLLETTGSPEHVAKLKELGKLKIAPEESDVYQALGLPIIEPELREGLTEIEEARANNLPRLIEFDDLKGSLHNHTTYSDGLNTLREMAEYCKNELHLEYLGVCDHSKTAVYANGLSVERIEQQWNEINQLNQELAPFKIFKGIESDILSNGDLDYPDEVLAKFDFVVASVHSNLKMTQEQATKRILKAIKNPYTTILGHPTGRLLLSRAGYPLDFEAIIDACAKYNVAIEINANPLRLDLDWRWHRYAMKQGVVLSINPDAHRTEGFLDMHYGILVARKGGVSSQQCLNAMTKSEIEDFFNRRKAVKSS